MINSRTLNELHTHALKYDQVMIPSSLFIQLISSKLKRKDKDKRYCDKRYAQGLCVSCPNKRFSKGSRCRKCLEKHRLAQGRRNKQKCQKQK